MLFRNHNQEVEDRRLRAESVIEQSKEGYYLSLRQAQVTIRTDVPNREPWVPFSFAHCSGK